MHIPTEKRIVERLEPSIDQSGNILGEYKLFMEGTARLSERRQSVTNTYITVNGALASLITFLAKDSGLNDLGLVLFMLPLLALGIIICQYWQRLLLKYRLLVGFRFQTLREMEKRIPSSIRIYHREDELYPRDDQDRVISG